MTPEQKAYLKDRFGIDIDHAKRSIRGISDKQVASAYAKFYAEKEKVLRMVTELENPDYTAFTSPRVERYKTAINREDEGTKREMESTNGENKALQQILQAGLSRLKEDIESHLKTEIGHAKEFAKCRAKIRGYFSIINESPVDHVDEMLGFSVRLGNAVKRNWRNGNSGDAVEIIKGVQSEAKTLSETAAREKQDKDKYDSRIHPAQTNLQFLKRTTGADDTQLKIMVNSATSLAAVDRYRDAYDALANHEKVFRSAYSAAEAIQRQNAENAASQDEVNRRVEEIDNFLFQCEQKIGTGSWVAEKRVAFAEILQLQKDGQFTEALAKLNHKKDWDLGKLGTDADKASQRRIDVLSKDTVSFSAIQGIETRLANYKVVATDAAVAEETKKFIDIQNRIDVGKVTVASGDLFSLESRLRDETARLEGIRNECTTLSNSVISKLDNLDTQQLGSTIDKAGYRGEFEKCQVGLEQRKLEQVKSLLEALIRGLDQFTAQQTEAKESWETRMTSYESLAGSTLDADLTTIQECSYTASFHKELASSRTESEATASGSDPDYITALDQFELLTPEVMKVAALAAKFNRLEALRTSTDLEVPGKAGEAETEIENLKKALAELG